MPKLTLILFFILIAAVKINAQSISVSGKVEDTLQKKAVQNAVVALINPKDSVLYKFTRTDAGEIGRAHV